MSTRKTIEKIKAGRLVDYPAAVNVLKSLGFTPKFKGTHGRWRHPSGHVITLVMREDHLRLTQVKELQRLLEDVERERERERERA